MWNKNKPKMKTHTHTHWSYVFVKLCNTAEKSWYLRPIMKNLYDQYQWAPAPKTKKWFFNQGQKESAYLLRKKNLSVLVRLWEVLVFLPAALFIGSLPRKVAINHKSHIIHHTLQQKRSACTCTHDYLHRDSCIIHNNKNI